jgi:ubiquinone/menaquinone biosynthesis C-methylase UbiE
MAVPRDEPKSSLFDAWTKAYDHPALQAFTYRPVQDAVLLALREQPPRHVVEIGCGTGLLAARMHDELGAIVLGCDPVWGMISRAQRRDPSPEWLQADAPALPIASATVDAIVCTESFHWCDDHQGALQEFSRVLRPGGRLYVALVNPPWESISAWTRRASQVYGQSLRFPTPARMRSMSAAAGLQVVRQQKLWRLPAVVLLPAVLTIAERPATG